MEYKINYSNNKYTGGRTESLYATQNSQQPKILVPIDISGYKEKIITYAASLAKVWGAQMSAIHVIDPMRGIWGGRIKEKEHEREQAAKASAAELLLQIEKLGQNQCLM